MGLDLSTQPNLDRWRRRIKRHRRPIAAALAALSVFAIIGAVSDKGGPTTTVVIAATDIPAGTTLTPDDLTTAEFPADLAPPGAPDNPATITGEVVTAGVSTGEVITTSRLLGSRPEAGRGLATQAFHATLEQPRPRLQIAETVQELLTNHPGCAELPGPAPSQRVLPQQAKLLGDGEGPQGRCI